MDNLQNYYNELDDEGEFEKLRASKPTNRKWTRRPWSSSSRGRIKAARRVAFTYKPARFEEGWLLDSLGPFFEQRWITDVLGKVKGGKEASVYLCRSGEQVMSPYVAAKVFRPRMLRNLKNDQLYRQDREVLDENGNRIVDLGMLKAQKKRSVYGEQIRHQSWLAYEFQTLEDPARGRRGCASAIRNERKRHPDELHRRRSHRRADPQHGQPGPGRK